MACSTQRVATLDSCTPYQNEREIATIPALSIKQPFASLVAHGLKTLEIRSRPISHRGRLLICASLKPYSDVMFDPENVDKWTQTANDYLPTLGNSTLFGHAIGLVNVVGCRLMTPDDERLAFVKYRPGAYCWQFENAMEIEPFRVVGQLGIFKVPASSVNLKFSLK